METGDERRRGHVAGRVEALLLNKRRRKRTDFGRTLAVPRERGMDLSLKIIIIIVKRERKGMLLSTSV